MMRFAYFLMLVVVYMTNAADIDLKIKGKIRRVSPQVPRHLERLNSAKILAQEAIDKAKLDGHQPSDLAISVAIITTLHPAKMWEQVARIQEKI